LQITSEEVPPRQVRLTVAVPASRMDRALHAAAQDLGKRARLHGYRPGKYPVSAVAAHVGPETLKAEAIDRMTNEVARAAIEAEDLVPSAPASVSVVSEEPLTLSVLVPLEPVVQLGDYARSLRIEEASPKAVANEDITNVLDAYRSEMAYLEPVSRPAASGDVVTVSIVGRTLDDKVIFEDDALTFRLDERGIQSALIPADALTHIVGHSAGDLFDFTLSYPDDWPQPELRARAVTFGTKLATVAEIAMPALDDDFATAVSDAEDLEALTARVRSGLEARAVIDAREEYAEAALAALVESAEVEMPPSLIEVEQARMVAELQSRVERQGITWERWLELQRLSDDELWAKLESEARMRLTRRLVLGAFVEAEGITVAAGEIDRAVEAARRTADRKSLPPTSELRQNAAQRILAEKALARLLAIASGDPDEPAESTPPQSQEE
jgi:trigger factor